MSNTDSYLETLEAPTRAALERVRTIVHATVPAAIEAFSYGMPAFTYKSAYLVGYGAFKKHLSFFPTAEPIEALRDQLGAFKLARGTIHFALDNPIPEELIKQLVLVRVAAISAQSAASRTT